MKSSRESVETSERLFSATMALLPRTVLYKKATSTSSIYCKMQDGYSLRIGDHKGKEKYSYKWNLGPQYTEKGEWRKEMNRLDRVPHWRFYTSSVEVLARAVEANEERMKSVQRRY